MVAAAVLCVIISMTLQVPELSVTAYMPFFVSKESKFLTTLTGVIGFIGLTIGIGGTLLLYKFTYGHPELRIPGMAIALFLGMWLSRVFVHRATRIPHRFCCRCLAVGRRSSPFT